MSFTPHRKHLIAGRWVETRQTFQSEPELAQRLLSVVEREAGHLLANGATSVGTMAIRRFLRPVSHQNIPMGVLPEDLR